MSKDIGILSLIHANAGFFIITMEYEPA